MQLLNKKSDYAIRTLMFLAENRQEYTGVREISDKENIPYHYLRGIVQKLRIKKIVDAKEGPSGGVKLLKAPDAIRILDIIEMFQGRFQIMSCMFRKNICPNRKSCRLRRKITDIERSVIESFSDITIGSLIDET